MVKTRFLDRWRGKKASGFADLLEQRTFDTMDPLLKALISNEEITREQALNIPAVAACVELIASTVAMIPIKLYREKGNEVTELKDDPRVFLLNDNTGDLLNGYQFKKAAVEDYLLDGAGYAFINRERNQISSLHYVARKYVTFQYGTDPIFKRCDICVNGVPYPDYQFWKITRKTEDGIRGRGVIQENNLFLSVVYNALKYEDVLNKTGGNKKGFLMSEKKLDGEAMKEIKAAYNRLYKGNTENMIVLNNGLVFKEMSASSVEMQMNENKQENAKGICQIFSVPPTLIGNASSYAAAQGDHEKFIKTAVLTVLNAMESACNEDLLLQSEKDPKSPDGALYFVADTKEMLKGDIEKRYKAYEIASKNGFMQIDEIRNREDLPPLDLDFIKLGLQDVLYDPKAKEFYIPNMNAKGSLKGGEKQNESGDSSPSGDT